MCDRYWKKNELKSLKLHIQQELFQSMHCMLLWRIGKQLLSIDLYKRKEHITHGNKELCRKILSYFRGELLLTILCRELGKIHRYKRTCNFITSMWR